MVYFSLEGKVALVTGASHGIGFAIAQAYAEAGAVVCFNCRSQEKVDKAMEAYKAAGIQAHGYDERKHISGYIERSGRNGNQAAEKNREGMFRKGRDHYQSYILSL